MKKTKLRQGARVLVFGNTERLETDVWPKSAIPDTEYSHYVSYRTLGTKGTVCVFDPSYPEGGVTVDLDQGGLVTVHPKQLTFLRKKSK